MAMVLAACGSTDPAPWASEAEVFLSELASAYQESDTYAVLDFYAPAAEVSVWRGDNQGGGPISDLLRWNSGDLFQELDQIYLGQTDAVTLIGWPNAGELGAVVSAVDNGLITSETILGLAASLGRSLRASPEVLAAYEELQARYAEAWSDGSTERLAALYAAGAVVRDQLTGVEATGPDGIAKLASSATWSAVAASGAGAPEGAELLFLGPAPYLQDPQQAVAVFAVEDGSGCTEQVAVHWILDDRLIAQERAGIEARFEEVTTTTVLTIRAPGEWLFQVLHEL